MTREPTTRRVEVSFVGVPPAQQVERASGVSEVEVEGPILRCLVCGSFQPFLEALRGHEVVSMSACPVAARAFFGTATVGTKGQIVIPADARSAMQVKEGDKVVVLRGPREGSILVFRVDSFDRFLEKAGMGAEDRAEMAAKHGD